MLLPELQVVAKLLISKIVQNGFVFLCVCELSTFSTDAADRFLDTIDLRVGFLGHVSLTLFLYPTISLCQVLELRIFGLEVASAVPETCFDLSRDIRGLIHCARDVCRDASESELAQVFRNRPRGKVHDLGCPCAAFGLYRSFGFLLLLSRRNGVAGSHFPLFFCVPAISG